MKIVHIVINKAFGELDIFNQCSCFTQKPRLSMLLKIKKIVIISYGALLHARQLATYTFSQKSQPYLITTIISILQLSKLSLR